MSLTSAQLKMIEGEERSSAALKEDDVSSFMLLKVHDASKINSRYKMLQLKLSKYF